MSKSLEFCKKRAADPTVSQFADRPWENAQEVDSEDIFKQLLVKTPGFRKYKLSGTLDDGTPINLNVELSFDPAADFDYFSSASCCHDGTLLFILDLMTELVNKVLTVNTYNKNMGEPESGDTIKYTIGNFVVLNEFSETEFATKEKPWIRQRTTVLLPLRTEKENRWEHH